MQIPNSMEFIEELNQKYEFLIFNMYKNDWMPKLKSLSDLNARLRKGTKDPSLRGSNIKWLFKVTPEQEKFEQEAAEYCEQQERNAMRMMKQHEKQKKREKRWRKFKNWCMGIEDIEDEENHPSWEYHIRDQREAVKSQRIRLYGAGIVDRVQTKAQMERNTKELYAEIEARKKALDKRIGLDHKNESR